MRLGRFFPTPVLGMVAISTDPGVGVMARSKRVRIEDIVDYFDELEDPRTSINLKHPLVSVVVIAMRGVLAGAHGPTAIARWGKIKKQFARAIRSHWGIENGCHWSLDMIYREDESRTREPNMRENFAWLNRFTLSL